MILLDKVGAEFENSYENCGKIIDRFTNNFVSGWSTENSMIKEINLKPVKLVHFKNFLRRYAVIAGYDGWEYVEGEDDDNAGGMHVHLSIATDSNDTAFGKVDELIDKSNWVTCLSGHLFGKEPYNYRDCALAHNTDGYVRAALATVDTYSSNAGSKTYAVTRNSPSGNYTIEFRINETPMPLWVYLVPVLAHNDKIFTEINKELLKIYNYDQREFLNNADARALMEKSVEIAQGLIPAVLQHWKDKGITSFDVFEKIMLEYSRNKFDGEATFGTILDELDKDSIWNTNYKTKCSWL